MAQCVARRKGGVMKRVTWSAPALVLSLTVGCSDGINSDGTIEPERNSKSLSATIDGVAFVAYTNTISITGDYTRTPQGRIILTAYDNSGRTISLTMSFIGGPGTYALGVNPETTPGGTALVALTSGPSIGDYLTPLDGESGFVTITARTNTRIAGTFSFIAVASQSSFDPPFRSVTDGEFEIAVGG